MQDNTEIFKFQQAGTEDSYWVCEDCIAAPVIRFGNDKIIDQRMMGCDDECIICGCTNHDDEEVR